MLVGELPTEALHGRDQAQVLELGRMQPMRQGLNVFRKFNGPTPQFFHAATELSQRSRQVLRELIKPYLQNCELLIDVVMQFPRNAGTFFLLRLNQTAADTSEGLFCRLAFGNIETRADVTGKRTVSVD